MDDVTVAILVGGRARRLDGRLKPGLTVGAVPIVDRQLGAIREAGARQILFVGRWPDASRPEGRHIPDVVADCGPLGGVYAALLLAVTPKVVVLAGDLPFVTAALLRRVSDVTPDVDAVVPRTSDGWHPLCAGYRRRVATAIKRRLDRGELAVSAALSDMRVREVNVGEMSAMDSDGMLLLNVNTPDDHQRAERHARARA